MKLNGLNNANRKILIERKYNLSIKEKLKEYMEQDIHHPKYLFYGSNEKMDIVDIGKENSNEPIFIFPEFVRATAYAFKDTIKKNSVGLKYRIIIKNQKIYPVMTLENVNIKDDMQGYIYVFKNNEDFMKDKHSMKYRCNKEQVPYDLITIKYSDFKEYYEVK